MAEASGENHHPPSGLKYTDLEVGQGLEAKSRARPSTSITTGWLENGTKFDSSLDRRSPFSFHLGGGQVIRGWERGRRRHASRRQAPPNHPRQSGLRRPRRRRRDFLPNANPDFRGRAARGQVGVSPNISSLGTSGGAKGDPQTSSAASRV